MAADAAMSDFPQQEPPIKLSRATFLGAGLSGLGASAALAQPANRTPYTADEQAALDLVTAFCQSFARRDMDEISSFLAEDVSYRIVETAPPRIGEDAIAQIRGYVESADAVEFEILDSWVKGPVVVNERIDRFTAPNRNREFHLTGVFLVREGKIREWTDYSIR